MSGRVERLPASCPLGNCDGSGWIVGDDDIARPCECRERRIAQARMAGVKRTLPRKYEGVGFDRPPISDMERDPRIADGRRSRARVHRRLSTRTSLRAAGSG